MAKIKIKGAKKKSKSTTVNETIPTECEGYKVVNLKCQEESTVTHCVLVKEHSVREKCVEKPAERTIFIRNVPPFVTETSLIAAFEKFGEIQSVFFHSTPCASVPPRNSSKFFEDVPLISGFKVAYLVFATNEGARNVLLAPGDETLVLFPKDRPLPSVLDKWIDDYNDRVKIDREALKNEVDGYMEQYDIAKEKVENQEKQKQEDDAEDGWVTVTKKTGIPRKESVHKKIEKKMDSRMKKTQLLNFYRFQIRESKMNQLVKLREKFEEDKKRITQLKESRKFKPF